MYMEELLRHFPNLESNIVVIEANVQLDHIHLVLYIPPRVAAARVVSFLKSQSSKRLKAKYAFLHKVYWDGGGIMVTRILCINRNQ